MFSVIKVASCHETSVWYGIVEFNIPLDVSHASELVAIGLQPLSLVTTTVSIDTCRNFIKGHVPAGGGKGIES